MKNRVKSFTLIVIVLLMIIGNFGCKNKEKEKKEQLATYVKERLSQFKEVELKYDISKLSSNEKKMLELMFEASQIADEIFWLQTY